MGMLRKLLSIAMLAVFVLPLFSSLFALSVGSDGNHPVCCRRNGKHHCMMSMEERVQLASRESESWVPLDKCPYCPPAVFLWRHSDPGTPPAVAIFAGLLSHPAVQTQTESKRRVARERSRHKRGPPSLILLQVIDPNSKA